VGFLEAAGMTRKRWLLGGAALAGLALLVLD